MSKAATSKTSPAAASQPPARPKEESRLHTRVLKCTLELANSRIFWAESAAAVPMQAEAAFEAGWFGHRSLSRMRELLTNLRARYGA
ncbi:MAG: hypothetical protein ACKOZW_03370, partial [Cyanobium sp.]